MGKTTNRVLSLVLTVLMVLSMISVFAVPAMAETPATTGTYDFDALLKAGNTYLINNSWTSRNLTAGNTLEFVFNGKTHSVTYDADKHFSSYADAFEKIWSGLTAANYFTYNPTIIFAPGEYDENIRLVGPCTVLGNNAGIAPNQARTADNWNTAYLEKNGGWPVNSARLTDAETVFSGKFEVNTRDPGDGEAMPASGDGAKWAVLKELGFGANPSGVFTTVTDGVKIANVKGVHHSGYDVGNSATWGDDTVKAAGGRQILTLIRNTTFDTTNSIASAWNTNNDYFNVEFDNIRSTGAAKVFIERYVENVKITNSYITGFSNRLTEEVTTRAKHSASFEMQSSIIYNGPSDNVWAFYGDPNQNNFKFTINDSLLYNVSGGNYGVFRIDSTKGYDSYYAITNNEIYHDYASTQTYFNGNPKYITSGRVYINFNGNRLISKTVKTFVPNSQYDAAEAGTLLWYNFDNNFWGETADSPGKKVTFLAGPNGGAALASGWDYNNPNYFYDYNMTYSSNGTKIVDVDFGEGNVVEVKNTTMLAKCTSTEGVITPEFFVDETKLGSATPKFEMATDIGFTNIIDEIDLSTLSGTATYYVRSYYEDTSYEHVYKLNVIAATPVDFNDGFMANGMEYAGYDLSYDNTAIYVKDVVTEGDAEYAYGFIDDTYYRFKVDNDLVFKSLDAIRSQMIRVKDPVILLPTGDYGDIDIEFAATYVGANAHIDPVDDTVSVLDDGSDWAIGKGWGDYGETSLGTIDVADGLEGKLVLDGITMRGHFNDTYRTMGKDGVAYGDLDITVKNMVIDQDGTAGTSDARSEYVKSVSLGGAGGQYLFNLINARSINFDNTQKEYDANGASTVVEYPGFGDTYSDSVTLKNIWVKNVTSSPRFMNEYVPANTTIENLYRDNVASNSDTIISWVKVGTAVKHGTFNFVKNNIRNSVNEEKDHPVLGIEGATRNNSAMRLPEGSTYDVNLSNNVFYNGNRDTEGMKMFSIEIAFLSSLKVNNNFVYADDDIAKTIQFVGHSTMYAANAGASDLAVVGNIEIDGNSFIGISDDNTLLSLGMGAYEPKLTNTFVTKDTATYLTNKKAGIHVSTMGDNDYWMDYARTISANMTRPTGLVPKTDKVSGQYLDNTKMEIGAIISEGSLSDIGIVLPEDVVGTWYTDEECTQSFEDKTVEEIGYNAVYYYKTVATIGETVYEYKYKAEIYTVEFIDFADAENLDPEYFSNEAVIVTDKAKGLATGSVVVEDWDGVKYRFYAGVNAFATYSDALASSTMPEILVTKATQDNGVLNSNLDLLISKSMKLYTPNYNVNPVKTDGFGANSPTQGKGWGYNTEFDKHKDDVHIKSISTWTPAGEQNVEIYGLTMDNAFNDNGRQVGSTINIKLVNTLNTRAKAGGYLFNFGTDNAKKSANGYVSVDQKNTMLVKNYYFAAEPADKESKSTARLMGEIIPAHITFDTLYLDFRASNFMYPGYVKTTAGDAAITFKNSYLANSVIRCTKDADKVADATFTESVNTIWNGYSYDENGDNILNDNQFNTIKDGHSNKIIFDNNILDNYAGFFRPSSGSAAMLHICGASFSEISITNNYIAAPRYIPASNGKTYEVKAYDMYWSAGNRWGDPITTAEGVYRVTGNVMNFVTGNTTYGEQGKRASNFTHYVYDNFRISNRVNDINDYGLDAQPMYYDSSKKIGVGTDYAKVVGETYYRLTADGEYLSNEINPYSFADRVSVTDNKATIDSAEGDLFKAVDGGYEFDLSLLIKNNFYKNRMTVTYGDTTVDMATGKITVTAEEFAENGYDFTITVDSIDGKAAEEVYTFTVTDKGTVSAFAGEDDVIKSTAIMITAEANGTDTVVEHWQGVPYTFVSGTTAFKTVEEALTFAAANSLTDVQLLLVNSTKATELNITYPCTIYAENWNTEPHTKDGNGPDSPTHGEGWENNVDYLANQTYVERIHLKEGFPTGGKFEIYGVSMVGAYFDQRTTQASVAKVKLQNILLDIEGNTNGKYMFALSNNANRYTAGNSFEMKNVNFYRANTSQNFSWFWGEYGPQTSIVDNIFVDDAAGVGLTDSTAYIKSQSENAVVEVKNSYINSSCENTGYNLAFEGNKSAVSYNSSTDTVNKNVKNEKLAVRFENNIIRNIAARKADNSGDGTCFIQTISYSMREFKFNNNYFDYEIGFLANNYKALTYNGSALAKTANADVMMTVDYIVTNNVFNGYATGVISFTPSGRVHSNSVLTIENNYRVEEYIPNLYTGNDPMGLPLDVYYKNTSSGNAYYALNYARNAYNTTVGVPTYEMLDNLIVESDNSVTYRPDDTLYLDGGELHGTVDHIIDTYPVYNTIKLVVNGVEGDLDATITDATAIAIRLYAQDGTTYKDFAVNVTSTTNHNFAQYDVIVAATCISDAVEKSDCDGSCGDAECTAYTTRVVVGSSANVEHSYSKNGTLIEGTATCQTNGRMIVKCTVEGCTAQTEVEAPNSTVLHEFKNSAYVAHEAATCTEAGTEIATCTWCTETYVRTNSTKYPINKNAHTWSEWTYNNDATCVKDGTETRTCDCGATETQTSDSHKAANVAHTWGKYVYNGDVTCKNDGTMTARCTVEGCRARNTIADPNFKASDDFHTFGEYKYNNDATCCKDGTQTAVCSFCGDKNTIAAPDTVLGHKDVSGQFKDVETGRWYNDAINYNVSHKYITGIATDEFGVDVKVTRGMFVTILARIAGVDTTKNAVTTKFTDVASNRFYTAAIKWASENGVVSGMSATTFAPESEITRQQLAVMIVNFANVQNITLTEKNAAIAFADAGSIAGWAKDEVAICQKAGIINGYTENGKTVFKPENTASRAEAAQMVYKFHSEFGNK